MATTKCPDCGGTVSTSAAACPHCGKPNGTTAADRPPLLTKPAGISNCSQHLYCWQACLPCPVFQARVCL
jgi:predicted amidophosphoribosyltransferase